ncbi:SusC/RagA family TonB-linked outer membrane protein [Ekhidna sp. To15]|uniref:SusC/RagA family TonB-linked outer membrane protein n=1 Tax=Ekhidna sp. To15 TaxID=3395267 RepID=UPI003F524BD8
MKPILTCLALLLMAFSISAQVTLRGTITDSNGDGLPGVTVKIDGTTTATVTDQNGSFTIQLTDGYETLIITAKGFQTQKVYLTGQNSLSVSMRSGSGDGNVVSMGIGSQSKDELTSSVSSVAAEDVSPAPLINLEQANQGVTAGLFVQNSSGTLGQPTQVRIRGGSSLTASNQPLYVVDGVPLASQNQSNINPSNIASIEILKDASATAIYGSRAANGVIIINTKDGNKGGLQVNVDYQFGVSETPKKLDIQSGDENLLQTFEFILRGFEDLANDLVFNPVIEIDGVTYNQIDRQFLETFYNSGIDSVKFVPSGGVGQTINLNIPGFYDELRTSGSTDWQNEVFRRGTSQRANVDFQGGSDELGYFASMGYTTQEGILIGNKFDRFNGSLSLDSKITDRLSANLNFNYIYTKDNRLPENQDLAFPLQAIVLPGSDTYSPSNNFQLDVRSLEYNPLTEVNYSSYIVTNNSIIGSLGLKYQINEKLSADVNGGVDISNIESDRFQGSQTQDGAGSGGGRTRTSTEEVTNTIFNGWLTYNDRVRDSDNLSIILGGSYQKSEASFTFNDTFFPTDAGVPGSAFVFLSAYTRISYGLGDQFDFQLSGRMDGSSKFGSSNRFGFFPAVSAGWKIHNATFFDVEPVSTLKLRASFGLVGNTPLDDFAYRQNYFRSSRYGLNATLEPANLANADLKWETTSQLNFGLDFGILNDRVSGSFDYYIKTTSDLLFPVPPPLYTGFSEYLANVAEMKNQGFEINLSTVNIQKADFSWTTDFNISSNKNTIEDLGNLPPLTVGVNAFREGESAGVFYMKKFIGVDPDTGNSLYDDGEGGTTDDWNEAPRMIVGDPNPKLFGGITNSVAYKNFEFSFMFQFVSGVDLYFQTGEFLSNSGILNLGQTLDQVDRWYATGDVTNVPRLDPTNNFPLQSSRWLSSGDYIRLKNITLTYNFPESMLNSLGGLRNMSVYISASNLLTFTDYIGYDPDVSYFDPLDGIIGQNISRGIDNFNTPQPRIIMSGIKIGL